MSVCFASVLPFVVPWTSAKFSARERKDRYHGEYTVNQGELSQGMCCQTFSSVESQDEEKSGEIEAFLHNKKKESQTDQSHNQL